METCKRCGKVLPSGWTEKFDNVCISCENDVTADEFDKLRAENERLNEQLASMNEVNTMLAKYGHDATHHLALILEADRNMDDMSQLLINAAQFIVDASEGVAP